MTTDTKPDEESISAVCIEGEMTIYRALELKQLLLSRLEEAAAVEVDLSAVTEIDTAGVQLMMLASQWARTRQRKLRIVAHSREVVEVLQLLNLETYFGDPSLTPPVRVSAEAGRAKSTSETSQ